LGAARPGEPSTNPPDINVFSRTREISFEVRETSRLREREKKGNPYKGLANDPKKRFSCCWRSNYGSPLTAASRIQNVGRSSWLVVAYTLDPVYFNLQYMYACILYDFTHSSLILM
jgi:hypothetical protein